MFAKTETNQEFAYALSLFVTSNLASFESKYPDLLEVLVEVDSSGPLPEWFQDNNYLLMTKAEQYDLSQQIFILNADPETWDFFSEYVDFEKKVGPS